MGGWKMVHEQLARLAKERANRDYEEGRWLLEGERAKVYRPLGFSSYWEYLERLFGYSRREASERLRVARALEGLRGIGAALERGALCWSVVRELTRVAIEDTEEEWLREAAGKTVRQVEQMVAGRSPGDKPDSPADPTKIKHVLRFEVTAETYATWREAVGRVRKQSDGALEDDDVLLLMARAVLEGPRDAGRASYQVAMTICSDCGRGWQQASGQQVEVSPAIVEMVGCDAQHVPCGGAHVGGGVATDGVGMSEAAEDADGAIGRMRRPRATQTIPPAVRREVDRRDGKKCVVPGCGCAIFTDVHHLDLRSEGGQHDPNRLVTLCVSHHRALHTGKLWVEGMVTPGAPNLGLRWRHADGTPYGCMDMDVDMAEAYAQAHKGLTWLGFTDKKVREVLSELRTHVGGRNAAEVIRAALLVLST